MPKFKKGPENENDGKYFWSNGTPSQPQLPRRTYSRSGDAIDVSLLRMPHSSEDKPPRTKYRRVEINPIFHVSDVSAQEPGPTTWRLNEPNPQLLSSVNVINDSSYGDVAADSGFVNQSNTTIFNLSRMPRNPEVGPPRAKYRRVEINPEFSVEMRRQLLYSDVVRMTVQDSSDSHMTGQPIPGGSSARNCLIDDSSEEDNASSPISFSVNNIQGNSTPRHSTSQEENLPPQQLQNSLSGMAKKYFFERLGFTISDFLKDSFVDKLKQKFARQREKSDKIRNKLIQRIEKAHSARKAYERAMFERISWFQFTKVPIYLVDSVEE